jgi:hypothetical protein
MAMKNPQKPTKGSPYRGETVNTWPVKAHAKKPKKAQPHNSVWVFL